MLSQKTLFKRYLFMSLGTIFLLFIILGSIILFFVSQYWMAEKRALLLENAETISEAVSNRIRIYNNRVNISESDTKMFNVIMRTVSEGIDANIYVTDNMGNVLITSDSSRTGRVNIKSVEKAMNGSFFEVSTMEDFLDVQSYNAGVPIRALDTNGKPVTVGVAFCCASSAYYNEFLVEITKIFFIAAVFTFTVIFCAVALFTYNMIKPLHLMSKAAASFGKGDFSQRVPVSSKDEIGQLAVAFNNMADSLASSEGMRRSFIANVSHELKTPMTTIAGFIDGILDGTISQDKQKYYLNIVSGEIRRLSRLVQTMLALSRIDSGELKLNYQNFDIRDTIFNILITFEKKIDEKSISITGLEDIEPAYIDGDKDMLHQVMYNLIENAVKFTNVNGYIDFKIDLNERLNQCNIQIKNSGQGIEPDEIGSVFDRFYKTDKSRSMDKNGMGLGLYIVKTIVGQHGGEVSASSTVGEHCTFSISLPINKTSHNSLAVRGNN